MRACIGPTNADRVLVHRKVRNAVDKKVLAAQQQGLQGAEMDHDRATPARAVTHDVWIHRCIWDINGTETVHCLFCFWMIPPPKTTIPSQTRGGGGLLEVCCWARGPD